LDFIVYACFNLVGNVIRGILGPLHPMIFWVLGCFFCLKLHEELNLKQGLIPWSCETKKNHKKEKETLPHGAFLFSLFLPPIFFTSNESHPHWTSVAIASIVITQGREVIFPHHCWHWRAWSSYPHHCCFPMAKEEMRN